MEYKKYAMNFLEGKIFETEKQNSLFVCQSGYSNLKFNVANLVDKAEWSAKNDLEKQMIKGVTIKVYPMQGQTHFQLIHWCLLSPVFIIKRTDTIIQRSDKI